MKTSKLGLKNHAQKFVLRGINLDPNCVNILLTHVTEVQYEGYKKIHPDNWDFQHCFTVFLKFWDCLFSKSFATNIPKSYIFIIKHFRNQWAHNANFTLRDAYRVADTVQLFFEMISAPTDEIR